VGSRRRFLEALVSLAALAATFTPGVAQANTRTRTKAPARGADRAFGLTPAIVAFSADVAARTGIPALWIRGHLAKARRLAAVQRLVMPPPACPRRLSSPSSASRPTSAASSATSG
jgi:hypothetical protein